MATALLRWFPVVPAMLDHTGLPRRNDRTSVAGWRTAMYKLAAVPHLSCKISGLAQADFDWTEDHVRPFVLDAIELFGVGRCCFGSNFPVDRLKVDYATLWRTFERITADFTEGERRALFHDNAVRFYRL